MFLKFTHNKCINADFAEEPCKTGYARCYVSTGNLKMRFFFLVFISLAFDVVADVPDSGCSVTDEMQQEMNIKYGDTISIETNLRESSYYVVIQTPSEINNGKIKAIWLFSDSMEDPTFIVPLETYEESDSVLAWYEIEAGLIRRHFIFVSFGDGCGSSVVKEVIYR